MRSSIFHTVPRTTLLANPDVNRKGFALTPIGGPVLANIANTPEDHGRRDIRHVRSSRKRR